MIKHLFKKLKLDQDHLLWGILSLRFLVLVLVVLLIFLVGGIVLLISIKSAKAVEEGFSFSKTILETANGILTPFIAATAVVTTFLAFLVQYQANQNQQNDIKRGRAETKFYELLRLHKENVNEIVVDEVGGREAFVKMYNEFRFASYVVLETLEEEQQKLDQNGLERLRIITNGDRQKDPIESREQAIVVIAYQICFFGIRNISEANISLHPKGISTSFFIKCLQKFRYYQQLELSKNSVLRLDSWSKLAREVELDSDSVPFNGNVAKLGHYYRHLYQLVKYVVTEDDLMISGEKSKSLWHQKYEYIKTIRAQLSNHEQALIYYNSFFIAGRIWYQDRTIDKRNDYNLPVSYFLDYAFVKNLPYNLVFRIGPWPYDLFEKLLLKREYQPGRFKLKEGDTIEKKLDWLFEWEGG